MLEDHSCTDRVSYKSLSKVFDIAHWIDLVYHLHGVELMIPKVSFGSEIGSLRITNINRDIKTNVKFLFKTGHAVLNLNRNFMCVYVSINVHYSQIQY